MIDIEPLLAPISDDAPCGEDLSYDADLVALETLIQGKAETQFSTAEEPNWKEVQKAALALSERTKDLRVILDLTLALTKLDGWPGFAQGMALLRGVIEKYWTELYPRLDPDDDNDPTERINLLATLSAPEGTYGDPLRFLERLRAAPLCKSGQFGAFSLVKIAEALDTKKGEGSGPTGAADPATIEGAFQDTPAELMDSIRAAVDGSTTDLDAIKEALDASVGAGQRPNLEALEKVLREAKNRLAAYAPVPTAAEDGDLDLGMSTDGESADDNTNLGAGRSARSSGAPGSINSRDDVLQALDAVCAFYAAQEPSSPVPALLAHARKMVGMNYLQIVAALTPDATPQVRLSEEAPAAVVAEDAS